MNRFARRLVDWQRLHGRHDLPWQNTRDPYRVWLSEIMLQQTQVVTVIAYYDRFLAAFPDVNALAAAPLEAAAAAAFAPAAVGLFGGMVLKERRQRSGACSFFCAALVPLRARGRVTTDREDAEQAAGGKSMRRMRPWWRVKEDRDVD